MLNRINEFSLTTNKYSKVNAERFFFFTSTKFEHQATQQQPWEGLLRLVKLSFSLSPFFPSPPLPLIEINLYMRTLHTLSRDPRIMDSVNQSQNVRSGFLPGVRSAFVYISSFSESDAVFCVLFCWVFFMGGRREEGFRDTVFYVYRLRLLCQKMWFRCFGMAW